MLMCGTNGPRGPGPPIDTRASTANTNVATNVPRVSWVPRSRMKVRSIRGPNWVDTRVSATITMENTTPTTVMMAAAIVVRICRAASAEPLITHEGSVKSPWKAAWSISNVITNRPMLASTSSAGTSHRLVRSTSRWWPDTWMRRITAPSAGGLTPVFPAQALYQPTQAGPRSCFRS